MFWREPRVGIDLLLEPTECAYSSYDEYSDDVRKKMQIANSIVETQLRAVFDRAKRRYDQRVKSVQFQVGDFAYYYSPRLQPGRGRKFRNLTSGPYKIVRKVNDVNYTIQKSPSTRMFIVHVDRLLKYRGETIPACWKNQVSSLASKAGFIDNQIIESRSESDEQPTFELNHCLFSLSKPLSVAELENNCITPGDLETEPVDTCRVQVEVGIVPAYDESGQFVRINNCWTPDSGLQNPSVTNVVRISKKADSSLPTRMLRYRRNRVARLIDPIKTSSVHRRLEIMRKKFNRMFRYRHNQSREGTGQN